MYNPLPRSTKKITPKENIGTDKRTAASNGVKRRHFYRHDFISVQGIALTFYLLQMVCFSRVSVFRNIYIKRFSMD